MLNYKRTHKCSRQMKRSIVFTKQSACRIAALDRGASCSIMRLLQWEKIFVLLTKLIPAPMSRSTEKFTLSLLVRHSEDGDCAWVLLRLQYLTCLL